MKSDSEKNYRHIRVGKWIFEVKTAKAIRVDEYGQPYDAVGQLSFCGDDMYVDGVLSKGSDEMVSQDMNDFFKFAQLMGAKNMQYDRFHNGEKSRRTIKLPTENQPENAPEGSPDGKIRLVR